MLIREGPEPATGLRAVQPPAAASSLHLSFYELETRPMHKEKDTGSFLYSFRFMKDTNLGQREGMICVSD